MGILAQRVDLSVAPYAAGATCGEVAQPRGVVADRTVQRVKSAGSVHHESGTDGDADGEAPLRLHRLTRPVDPPAGWWCTRLCLDLTDVVVTQEGAQRERHVQDVPADVLNLLSVVNVRVDAVAEYKKRVPGPPDAAQHPALYAHLGRHRAQVVPRAHARPCRVRQPAHGDA